MYNNIKYLIALFFITLSATSQEGIAVYSDYLSDNYYLIHPSMAGAANCANYELQVKAVVWSGRCARVANCEF
jgi:hypothetical protein